MEGELFHLRSSTGYRLSAQTQALLEILTDKFVLLPVYYTCIDRRRTCFDKVL